MAAGRSPIPKHAPILLKAKITDGVGGVVLPAPLIMGRRPDGPVGGVGGRGQRHRFDGSAEKLHAVTSREVVVDKCEGKMMFGQLPTKEIFRAVPAVAAGKHHHLHAGVGTHDPDEVAQRDVLHGGIGGIHPLTATGFDDVTDADFMVFKKGQALRHRLRRIVIAQIEGEQAIEHRPQLSIATAVTKIDILFTQPAQGETRWRQGANDQLDRPIGD